MNVSKKQAAVVGILGVAALLLPLSGCGGGHDEQQAHGGPGAGAQQAPRVEVVEVDLKAVPWEQTYPGRVEGVRRTEVRPRVGGIIVERAYKEGAVVNEGDELFQIDPDPYKVAVERAQAQLKRAEANMRQTEREWNRVKGLFGSGAVSERQRDDAQSAYELAEADAAVARAALHEAQLNLDYTTVRAPIGGVTSLEVLNEGSLVSSQDRLTTITQLDPIYVLFSLPEGDPAYQQLLSQSADPDAGSVKMKLFTRDGDTYGEAGTINFTEMGVDPETGTVRVRAQFPNEDHRLLPGQFVRVAFDNLKLKPAAIVPEGAVLTSQRGSIVYTVSPDSKVAPRPVTLGPIMPEGQLITKGLQNGDKVITTALIRIRPGMPVQPVPAKQAGNGQQQGGAQGPQQGGAPQSQQGAGAPEQGH